MVSETCYLTSEIYCTLHSIWLSHYWLRHCGVIIYNTLQILPNRNIAAVDHNRPQFCIGTLPGLGCDSAGSRSPTGRQQRVLVGRGPLVALRAGHGGGGPGVDQLSQHRVGVGAQAQLLQRGLHLCRGVAELLEEVHPEVELAAVLFRRVRSRALAEKCLFHPGASGPLFSSLKGAWESACSLFINWQRGKLHVRYLKRVSDSQFSISATLSVRMACVSSARPIWLLWKLHFFTFELNLKN